MPTVRVILKEFQVSRDDKHLVREYPDAEAQIDSSHGHVLQVYKAGQAHEARHLLAEFQAETYLYWEYVTPPGAR